MGVLAAADGELLGRRAAESPVEATAAVARAKELRDVMLRLFTAVAAKQGPRAEHLQVLSAALPRLRVLAGPSGFRWDPGGDAEALDRVLGIVAFSAAELLTRRVSDGCVSAPPMTATGSSSIAAAGVCGAT